jgi:hypothetical protein
MTGTAPDFIEPFEAWRAWRVVRTGGAFRLGSVVQHTVWPTNSELSADCHRLRLFRRRRRRHVAPDMRCECGIYAAATLEQLRLYVVEGLRGHLSRVVGRVALWGTVVECERGFRASRAYPARLYVPADAGAQWQMSATEVALGLCAYGVPLEPVEVPAAQLPDLLVTTVLRRAR